MAEQKAEQPTPIVVAPSKTSKGWMIVAVVLVVVLLALAGFGYYKWQQYRTLTGNLGAKVSALETQVQQLQAASQKPQVAATISDADAIRKVVTDHVEADASEVVGKTTQIGSPTYTANKAFAEVGITPLVNGQPGPGGGFAILKKVNGDWTIVAEGQQILPEDQQRYGIPANFPSGQ